MATADKGTPSMTWFFIAIAIWAVGMNLLIPNRFK